MKSLRLLTFLLSSAIAAPLFAQATSPGAPSTTQAKLAVNVDVGTSGLDAGVIRTAIGKELGIDVSSGAAEATLSVKISARRARVSFERAGSEPLVREIELPVDRASSVEVIALLAGNLARDEAHDLIASMKKPESAPPASSDVPTPSAPAASAPETKAKPAPKHSPDAKAKPKTQSDTQPKPEPESDSKFGRDEPLALNLSLYHPLQIVRHSERHTFNAELGLLYSRIGGLEGVGITVGHLRIDGHAEGVGLAGLWTRIDGPADGAFASGIFGQARGRLRGAEGAGILMLRDGDVDGAQGAGILATSNRVRGVQLAGIASWADGPIRGVQGAGIVARARGDIEGVQGSLVNIGGDVDGAQLGLVNVGGHVRGTQIGVVNVADRVDGLPLGIVNVVKQGRTQAVAFADTQIPVTAGVKYLNGPVYTLVGAGYDGKDGAAWAFALGAHIAATRALFVEIDALYRYRSDFKDTDGDPDRHLSAGRVLLGLDHLGPVGLFAGGGLGHAVDADGKNSEFRAYGVAGATLF